MNTTWNPRGSKPAATGRYEVRPFETTDMVSEATWDGEKWRYLTDGRECYFQDMQWTAPVQELAA